MSIANLRWMKISTIFISLTATLASCTTSYSQNYQCDSFNVSNVSIAAGEKSFVEIKRFRVIRVENSVDTSISEELVVDTRPTDGIKIVSFDPKLPAKGELRIALLGSREISRKVTGESIPTELDWVNVEAGEYIVYEENEIFPGTAKIFCEGTGEGGQVSFKLYGGMVIDGVLLCGIQPSPQSAGIRAQEYCDSN
jgi:hypothetical protein